jgi:predicted DNA-binding protein (UPF0251 family)
MEAERLIMIKKEQDRSEVIRLYVEGYIKQKEAAKRLGISTRQIRNVAHAYRLDGAHGLIHGNRGKESNRKIREASKQSGSSDFGVVANGRASPGRGIKTYYGTSLFPVHGSSFRSGGGNP